MKNILFAFAFLLASLSLASAQGTTTIGAASDDVVNVTATPSPSPTPAVMPEVADDEAPATEPKPEDTKLVSDLAFFQKVTKDGLAANQIAWYNAGIGKTKFQFTANFECADCVSLKIGREFDFGKVAVTPFVGFTAGASGQFIAENWIYVPVSKKVSAFNLTQFVGNGGKDDFVYTYTDIGYQVNAQWKFSALQQSTFNINGKPTNEVGIGLKFSPTKNIYFPIQYFHPFGGRDKVLFGIGFNFSTAWKFWR